MTQKFTAEEVRRAVVQMRVVNLGELQVEQMLIAYADTLRQQGERGDGAVSDDRMYEALRFYAGKHHFMLSDEDAWDTVSGEPQNYWCDEAGTATVEDGSVARAALEAVAPLLRAPAEQGGRVDGLDGAADRLGDYLVREQSVYLSHKSLRSALQAALAQNAQPNTLGDFVRLPDAERQKFGQSIAAGVDERMAQNAQGEAVAVVSGSDTVLGRESRSLHWLIKDPYTLPPGTKLYTHAERARVPDGWVLVPRSMHIDAGAWETAQFAFGGPGTGEDEPFMDCTMWVGDIMDEDTGIKTHGLHVSCDECPEEGSITLAEFAAPSQPEDAGEVES